MIISKSNIAKNASSTLNTGTVSSGSVSNALNSDFSKVVSSDSSTFRFTISASGSVQYIGLHGLSVPIGSVISITAGAFSDSFTTVNATKNLVFYIESAVSVSSIIIQIVGSGTKTISYIQAGLVTNVSWGVNSGQSLYYLGKNTQERVSVSSRGAPIARITEEKAPTLRLSMQNMLKTWVRGDLQQVIAHYNDCGVLSIVDYEEDGNPDESVAGFELSAFAPTAHNQTTQLMNVTLSLRVSA